MGQQDIVNYWHFSAKIFRNSHKRLVPKTARHDQWEMFVKVSLPDRLVCFADFVGTILIACFTYASSILLIPAFRCLLLLPNCFLSLHSQSLQLCWKFFCRKQLLQFVTQQFFTSQYRQMQRSLFHAVNQKAYGMEPLIAWRQLTRKFHSVRKRSWKLFWTSKQDEWYRQT